MMKTPEWTKPAVWGAVVGAVATVIVGFSQMGWTTAHSAASMADQRAETAVIAALVPFCVANAERDGDAAKLVKFKAEESEYSRNAIVSDAGWATMPGMSSPDRGLASACAEKLRGPKV
jgi:hypothetical protein